MTGGCYKGGRCWEHNDPIARKEIMSICALQDWVPAVMSRPLGRPKGRTQWGAGRRQPFEPMMEMMRLQGGNYSS